MQQAHLAAEIPLRVLAILLFSLTVAVGQDSSVAENENGRNRGVYGLGGIGPAIPLGDFGNERQSGFDLNTALEYRFASGFLIRGMFDFSSFEFNRGTVSQMSNGTVYAISGSNNLISLNISGGYGILLGRFRPYGFAGPGVSFVSKPEIAIDKTQNTVDLGLQVGSNLSLISGVGLDYFIKKQKEDEKTSSLSLYLEAFYTYIPSQTDVSVYKFNVLAFNIGIKSKF